MKRRGRTLIDVFGFAKNPPKTLHTIEMWDPDRRSWRGLDTLFSREQLVTAREIYLEEIERVLTAGKTLGYVAQTAARAILTGIDPTMRDFDYISTGFAVISDKVRFDGILLPRSARWKTAQKAISRATGGL